MTRHITYPTGISIVVDGRTISGKELIEIKFSYEPDNMFIIGMSPDAAKEFIKEISNCLENLHPQVSTKEPDA